MSVLLTIELSHDIFWPPLPTSSDKEPWCECPNIFRGYLKEETETFELKGYERLVEVKVPVFGCSKCGWRHKDKYTRQLVRRLLNQYLPEGPQLPQFRQIIKVSKEKVERRFLEPLGASNL